MVRYIVLFIVSVLFFAQVQAKKKKQIDEKKEYSGQLTELDLSVLSSETSLSSAQYFTPRDQLINSISRGLSDSQNECAVAFPRQIKLPTNEEIKACLKKLGFKKKQCTVFSVNDLGFTPLHVAVLRSDLASVELLLCDPDVDSNCKTKYEGKTPLILAVIQNNIEIVTLLINEPFRKIDVNLSDVWGNTALHWAYWLNREEVVVHLSSDDRFVWWLKNLNNYDLYAIAQKNCSENLRKLAAVKSQPQNIVLLEKRASQTLLKK